MNLIEALTEIAEKLNFDAAALIDAAGEDHYGGYHPVAAQATFPIGSLFGVEGQVLYALVRVLQPKLVIELGTLRGASATHIAAALVANGSGKLFCVDTTMQADLIPDELRDVVTLVGEDGVEYLDATKSKQIGLIFEDMGHGKAQVSDAWRIGGAKLASGGVIVSHDSLHWVVGEDVLGGIRDAGYDNTVDVLIEPSDCGLTLWRNQ